MKVLPTHAYCMNLPKRQDRWDKLLAHFRELQEILPITLVKVPAIPIVERPQRGTAETVHKIIRQAKELNLEYVLILEDDLYIIDPVAVREALQNAPEEWDILLGGVYHFVPDVEYNKFWMQLKDFCSLHFVIFHSRIYDRILAINGQGQHMDRALGSITRSKQIKTFVMHPMPCQQNCGYSDIRRRKVNDNTRKLPWLQKENTLK